MFHRSFVRSFVCSPDNANTTQSISTKFDGTVEREPRKKPLDFGDNPISRYDRVRVTVRWGTALLRLGGQNVIRY